MNVKPTICIDEVKRHYKDNKLHKYTDQIVDFFYIVLPDNQILAKFGYDELLYNIQKLGYEILNINGSLYDIEEGF